MYGNPSFYQNYNDIYDSKRLPMRFKHKLPVKHVPIWFKIRVLNQF